MGPHCWTPDSSATSMTAPSKGGCVCTVCAHESPVFSTQAGWSCPLTHTTDCLLHTLKAPQTCLGPSLPHFQPSPPFLLTASLMTTSLILPPALHSSSSLNLVACWGHWLLGAESREEGGLLPHPRQEWKPLRWSLLQPSRGKIKAFGELSHM